MEDVIESEVISSTSMNADVSAGASSSCSQYLTARNKSIEESKLHWSDLLEIDSDLSDDQIVADNREVFKSLLSHPIWGKLFWIVNEESVPSLVVGEKFAEGGQAEIFSASYEWRNISESERTYDWVLKVFKKGTLLQHLQSQWPHGYLQWRGNTLEQIKPRFRNYVVLVERGVLLPTGEFAFLMEKEDEDLRNFIVRNRGVHGFFEKERNEEFMYQIASGMDWLHKQNIVHRDLKASNILVSSNICYVADFECSIGVIGTGFWRDPQILQACKERNASQRPELFTRALDVYSYGMTCYEILTGKLPFEDENVTINHVIEGQRPEVPKNVDNWILELLSTCWQFKRSARPTFEEILKIIVANTTSLYIKTRHEWDMKRNYEETISLLGCKNLPHGLDMMERLPYESGVYVCKFCFKQGNGAVYHCSSCSDFDIHPECATIPTSILSFMHPHELLLCPIFVQRGQKIKCDACQLEVQEGNYHSIYKCLEEECNFDLHIHCAKYARTILHYSHEKHELILSHLSTMVKVGESTPLCSSCNNEIGPLEIIYVCRECGFNMHPHCIVGKFECKSW